MQTTHKKKIFPELRQKYPRFIFEDYTIKKIRDEIIISYIFNLSDAYLFSPTLTIPVRSGYRGINADGKLMNNIAFHIGLLEAISYWKSTCSPELIIKPFRLSPSQIRWWRELFYLGLGEFRYFNDIDCSEENFIHIRSTSSQHISKIPSETGDTAIVPVGGGKDSAVTLEIMKEYDAIPFAINPIPAITRTAEKAGFPPNAILSFKRTIDPQLLEMNRMGFLNGHTPFSALIAFQSLLAAIITGSSQIVLSNESSANQATVPGSDINHQYSKSFHFEKKFREYIDEYLTVGIEYFSLLRPLNELQIAAIFSKHKQYHEAFRSCNRGSKTDTWCGQCPKCLFTYIILSPFMAKNELDAIFGKNLLNDTHLKHILYELTGHSESKPFECVGTIEEIRSALSYIILKNDNRELPALLKDRNFLSNDLITVENIFKSYLRNYNPEHFVPDRLLQSLIQSLNESIS